MNEKFINNLRQLAKAVAFFSQAIENPISLTKLNKLLFYTQFYHKKYNDVCYFEDATFVKQDFGPVFDNIHASLHQLHNHKYINFDTSKNNTVIHQIDTINASQYTRHEINTLTAIANKFKDYTFIDLFEYTKHEPLYKTSKLHHEINIDHAYKLNDFE